MLASPIAVFLLGSLAAVIVEWRFRQPRFRIISYTALMLIALSLVGIHYWRIAPLASSDRLEIRGQYFPLESTIQISGDPTEADYYAPALFSHGQNERAYENPLIELSNYDDRNLTLQATAKRMPRPLRHNDQFINTKTVSIGNSIQVGSLSMVYEAPSLILLVIIASIFLLGAIAPLFRSKFRQSKSLILFYLALILLGLVTFGFLRAFGLLSDKLVVNEKEYKITKPGGGVISLSELLCRAGLSPQAQYASIFPSGSTPNGNANNLPEQNPLDQVWLTSEGWRSLSLINGSSESVRVNGEVWPSESRFTVSNNDQIVYGIGSRAFRIKVSTEPADNRIYLIPEKPLTFPLYRPQDGAEGPETKVFISSAPTTADRAYQLALGDKNRDLIKGVIEYTANPARSGATDSPEQRSEGRAQSSSTLREGFIINSGDSLRSYKDGETALIGSNRGGVLISLNRTQIGSWRPLVDVIAIWIISACFFVAFGWISRTNYLFVLMPIVHFAIAIRLVLSYRGYALPPNLSESYEKALFAAIFIPFAIFLWLYIGDLAAPFSYLAPDSYRRSGRAWRESLLGIFVMPPLWYLLISLLLQWLVGVFSSSIQPLAITLIFFAVTLVIAKILAPTLQGSTETHPLLSWLERGLLSFSYPGRSLLSRLKAWVVNRPTWDFLVLLILPVLLAGLLRLSGMSTEQILGFRAEVLYQPCLFLGSCRLYMWSFSKIFGNPIAEIRWHEYGWLAFPIAIYFLQSWIVGDWGFFLYALPVLLLAMIISWRANPAIPFTTLGILAVVVFLFLGTSLFTQSAAAMLPDESTIRYRWIAYQGTGWLQEAALEDTANQSGESQCRTGSRAARRIFGIHEHFWTMFHFAARGGSGVGYGSAPIERIPFTDGIAQSDNTYSIYILSEHGYWGGGLVLALYLFLMLYIILILTQHFAGNPAAALLVGGIAMTILFSALYHAAGNVGGVPFTGKNFPLLSLNSTSDILLVGLLLALAFSVIGNCGEDSRETNVGILESFRGEGNALNRWLLGIALLFTSFFAWSFASSYQAANNKNYMGDYNLDRFIENTKRYIDNGIIKLNEQNLTIELSTDKAQGLAEGQYLRLLRDQFNNASPEEKRAGRYFFQVRDLYLDEDIYGSESKGDRYRDTILTVDQNYFRRPSPFATKVVWQGGLRSSDSGSVKQGHLSGEGISLFLIHKLDLPQPIPGINEQTVVRLSKADISPILAQQYTGRRFKVDNENGEHLFDIYAVEGDAVFEPRARPVYINGQEASQKMRVDPGDIIAIGPSPRTGGRKLVFAYGQAASGVLAHYQWLNGYQAFTYPQGETFALARPIVEAINTTVGNLNQNAEGEEAQRAVKLPLTLTINADLNRKLYEKLLVEGNRVWREINAKTELPPRLAVTVMEPNTGQVLAMTSWPSYDPNPRSANQEKADPRSYTNLMQRRDPERFRLFFNHNLTRHVLGSATKPFIASASARKFPILLNMEVEDSRGSYDEVFDIPTRPAWSSSAAGRVNWDKFLIDSNNMYAVSIGFMGLVQPSENDQLQFTNRSLSRSFWLNGQQQRYQPDFDGRLKNGSNEALNLDTSPLAVGLNELFDIQISGPDESPISEVWQAAKEMRLLPQRGALLDFISPEMPNLALNNIRDTRQFVMVCLGGKTNLWSNVKTAESFSRLITGHRVSSTFVKTESPTEFNSLDGSFLAIQPALLRALEGVCQTGTAKALAPKINEFNSIRGGGDGKRLVVFAKTGTLRNQYLSGRNDSNIVLAVGLWDPATRRLTNGAVLSIYIEKGDRAGGFGRATEFALKLMDILDQHFGWTGIARNR